MLSDFPKVHGKDREDKILNIIDNDPQRLHYTWISLDVESEGNVAKFFVMNDALKIDGIRVNVTADTQQRIADKLGAMLLTAKLSDLIWHHADIRLKPCTMPITSTTEAMIKHSQNVERQLKNIDYSEKLVSTVGKDWIIDQKMLNKHVSINHGWHFEGNSYMGIKGNVNPSLLKNPKTEQYWRLIQSIGSAHKGTEHTDYSQICRLVTRECFINNEKMDIIDVLKDKKLCNLASHCGPMSIFRQSGVPQTSEFVVI